MPNNELDVIYVADYRESQVKANLKCRPFPKAAERLTMSQELMAMLERAFEESTKLYKEKRLQRRIGFGKRPALIRRRSGKRVDPSG